MRGIPTAPADHSGAAQRVEREQNDQRLHSCPGPHRFVREVARVEGRPSDAPRIVDHRTPTGPRRDRIAETGMLRCGTCLGRVTAEQAEWYERGMRHGMEHEQRPKRRPPPMDHDDGIDGGKGIV